MPPAFVINNQYLKFKKTLFYDLLVLFAFISCSKQEEVRPETTSNNLLISQMVSFSSNTEGLDLGCFSVDFPFDLDVAGIVVTINNDDGFETVHARGYT